jgi:hypothetical protein
MNEPQLDQKIQQDITQVKKDLNTLKEDGINKVSEVGSDLGRSTEDVAAWVNSNVAQLSTDFEKVKGDATKKVAQATTTVKKNVGDGLIQYNAKVAGVAVKLPGGFAANAGMYPWVSITFAFLAGFLLRGLWMMRRDNNENCDQPGCTQNVG